MAHGSPEVCAQTSANLSLCQQPVLGHKQSYWMRWDGQRYLGALKRTSVVLNASYIYSFSLVAVILEQLIPSCWSIAIQTAFEEMSESSPTDKALSAEKHARARPLEKLGPKGK